MALYGRSPVFAVHGPLRLDCQINSRVPDDIFFGGFSNLHRIVCDHDEPARILDGGSEARPSQMHFAVRAPRCYCTDKANLGYMQR